MSKVRKLTSTVPVFALLAMGACSVARGAEIRLRHECRPGGALVRLGDVAEVLAGDKKQARQLEEIELFPAPQLGQKRFVRAREIQDALQLQGMNLTEHRLSGASQVEVAAPLEAKAAAAPAAVSSTAMRQAKRAVRDAIVEHLRRAASAAESWDVEFDLNDEQVRLLAGAEKQLEVDGGISPWVGEQQFAITARSGDAPVQIHIDARVTLPPMSVMVIRSLPRGAIVHASDVKLERGREGAADGEAFARLDDVVGKEVARSIAAGQLVRHDAVRAPLVVKRGEVVTVYARQAGLVVRTTARSRDDGSLGEVITVESLLNRQTFYARASGVQEVEVFAHAIDASATQREVPMPAASRDLANQQKQEKNRP